MEKKIKKLKIIRRILIAVIVLLSPLYLFFAGVLVYIATQPDISPSVYTVQAFDEGESCFFEDFQLKVEEVTKSNLSAEYLLLSASCTENGVRKSFEVRYILFEHRTFGFMLVDGETEYFFESHIHGRRLTVTLTCGEGETFQKCSFIMKKGGR